MQTNLFTQLLDALSEQKLIVNEPNESQYFELDFIIDGHTYGLLFIGGVYGGWEEVDFDEPNASFITRYTEADDIKLIDEDDNEVKFNAFQLLQVEKMIKNKLNFN